MSKLYVKLNPVVNGEKDTGTTIYPFVNANVMDSENATNGQVLTADGNGGSSWQTLENGEMPIVTRNVEIESTDWVSDGITGYSYSADIEVQGATEYDTSIVTFDPADADSGDFASICDTTEDTVTIYSKTARNVTIPLILTVKTDTAPTPPPIVTDPAILYETGTQTVKMAWSELESGDYLSFSNGTLNGGSNRQQLDGDLVISSGVTSIGFSAFDGCSSLTSITIPNSIVSILAYAFYGCSSLTSVTIPSSVTRLGSYAFTSCSGLTSLIINADYNNETNSNTLTSGQNYGYDQYPNIIYSDGYYDVNWDKVT